MNLLRYHKLRLWIRQHGTALCWTAIAMGAATTLVLGFIGFRQNALAQSPPLNYTFSTALYLALQLFLMTSGGVQGDITWQLELARFAAGVVLVGTLVRLIATLFRDRLKDLRLCLYHDHVILCGLGHKGVKLVEEFLASGQGSSGNISDCKNGLAADAMSAKESLSVVVIERDPDNGHLKTVSDLGAEVIVADAADPYILRKAGIQRARYLIAVTPDDGSNIRIAAIARTLAGQRLSCENPPRIGRRTTLVQRILGWGRPRLQPLQCHIHVVDRELFVLLSQRTDLGRDSCEVHPFDVFVNSARLLFQNLFLDPGVIQADDPRTVHLVIIGLGRMGKAVLVQAARTCQYANLRMPRITVIDRAASRKQNLLASCYPYLSLCCDLRFLEGDTDDPRIREQLEQWTQDAGQVLTVAVCLDDDHQSMSCALHLPRELRRLKVPVYVRLSEPCGFKDLLKDGSERGSTQFHSFGAPEDACTVEQVFRSGTEALAPVIHNAYWKSELDKLASVPQPAAGEVQSSPNAELLATLRPWEELTEHYKNSNREQAEHIAWKLAAIGCHTVRKEQCRGESVKQFTDDEIETLAKMEHLRWCAEKWLDGWQKGPSKDQDQRTHPNLVPWEELSEEDRNKDRDPVRSIPDLVKGSNSVIERNTAS
ncbi:MAG: NAD-binding protein [Planctomycetota bacterium]